MKSVKKPLIPQENEQPVIHKSVLVQEVLHYLDPQPGKVYVDVTLGGGGHTRQILQKAKCTVIGMDWDKSVIESTGVQLQEEFGERFIPVWGNFSRINMILEKKGITKVDGILADFGTSQMQIAHTPGLSLYNDEFLDMRMSTAYFKTTAYTIIKRATEEELANIFFTYGEERHSRKIARALVQHRQNESIKTTKQLAKIIEDVVGFDKKSKIHPATRVFQALRIVVNKELENIESFIQNSMKILLPEGRLVCISFHSLEDRIVKTLFKKYQTDPFVQAEILTPRVVTATQEELDLNRSSRSAKLRAIKMKK